MRTIKALLFVVSLAIALVAGLYANPPTVTKNEVGNPSQSSPPAAVTATFTKTAAGAMNVTEINPTVEVRQTSPPVANSFANTTISSLVNVDYSLTATAFNTVNASPIDRTINVLVGFRIRPPIVLISTTMAGRSAATPHYAGHFALPANTDVGKGETADANKIVASSSFNSFAEDTPTAVRVDDVRFVKRE